MPNCISHMCGLTKIMYIGYLGKFYVMMHCNRPIFDYLLFLVKALEDHQFPFSYASVMFFFFFGWSCGVFSLIRRGVVKALMKHYKRGRGIFN